jgi:signal transduction histidine kinase
MGPRRILLIAAQQAVPAASEAGDEGDYTLASHREAATMLEARPPFDAIVIDGATGDEAAASLALVGQLATAGYPAPAIVIVPPGADTLAREALAAGAWGCVARTGDYREQLRWTLAAAVARFHAPRQQRQPAPVRAIPALHEVDAGRQAAVERLRATLSHLYEGVVIVDAGAGTVLASNAAAERLFGAVFLPGEVPGTQPGYQLRDRTGRAIAPEESPIRRVIATGQARIGDRLVVERPDGVQVAVVVSTVPLRDAAGELREVVSIYQELTDQAHAQLVRDEVLSIASHELRTPLTVILGYSSLLRSLPGAAQDARTQRALTKIYEQSLRMRDLIEHLLDFSRIALGRIQLQWIAFDLNTLVREVGERQQAEAGPRQLRLALPDGPLAMTGDYGRLAQALQQVIRAAWQQTSKGEVVVSLYTGTPASFRTLGMVLPAETERRYALIHVAQGTSTPHGATPSPGNGAHLSTIDNISPDKALELTVSAELVRLHGGALLVEPQPSQGSAFSLLLPLQESAAS